MFFEQGPIRPPSEAESLLLRFTRNCPWNRCDFCGTYKGETFSRRTLEEIKRDIDNVCLIAEKIRERSWQMGYGGEINRQVLSDLYQSGSHLVIHVAAWLYRGGKTVFIQDANSLIMKTRELAEALRYLKERLPSVERITSYARSQTLARKDPRELEELREAGLNRIHVGMESGSDAVLKYMNKGATAREHIEGGRKVVEAGISLCEYVLLGLGGRLWPEEHYLETARVLNRINPDFIRMRTLAVIEETPLGEKRARGEFTEQTEDEIVAGERLLIENLDGINSQVVSDHMLNLLEEVRGRLPEDKEFMISVIDRYLSLPGRERLNFRLGKRWGLYRGLADLNDPPRHARVEAMVRRLEEEGRLDGTISSLRASMI
ncbi:MAG: radical SAM protein [Peptococcaceae bacterium]|nr:radical SAM protein [Peptococcaceae bacterium]